MWISSVIVDRYVLPMYSIDYRNILTYICSAFGVLSSRTHRGNEDDE